MENHQPSRRHLLYGAAAAAVAAPGLLGGRAHGQETERDSAVPRPHDVPSDRRIYKSLKIGMVDEPDLSLVEKFELLREVGFDGVEFNSPDMDLEAVIDASNRTGLVVDGTVDHLHWNIRLSDPDPEVREQGYEGLIRALHETHAVGGHSVLLVPGRVNDEENENQQQVWDRSIEYIRRALPTAAHLGVFIAIENVWNGFNYVHDGPSDQTADKFVEYIDTIDSPWVAMQFDIGNHQRYGNQPEWIRTLGSRRIVKLDVKDWGTEGGFTKIGDGDVPWDEVREALADINYTGWAAAEVAGGNRERLREVSERMDRYLLGL